MTLCRDCGHAHAAWLSCYSAAKQRWIAAQVPQDWVRAHPGCDPFWAYPRTEDSGQ